MIQELTYTAGEAAEITSVNVNTQLAWRSRGFLPSVGGKWARFTLRDLARMLTLKTCSDRGMPLKDGASFAEEFASNLAEATFALLRDLPPRSKVLAITAETDSGRRMFVCSDFASVHRELADRAITSLLAVNLAPLAAEMAEKIKLVDVDRDIDRRIETLDEEMAKRGI